MLLARGSLTDRPWGQTLGALAAKRLSGQLTISSEDKAFALAFIDGAIVGATSPLTADAALRIALTNHMVSKSAVNDITRRLAAATDRDEIEVIVEATNLSADLAERLRRKALVQRAARTHQLEVGEFTIDSDISIPTVDGVEVTVPAVVYLGAKMYLSEQRLVDALREFGHAYILKPDVDALLEKFAFSESGEQRIVQELVTGTSLPELEAAHRDIDPRTVQAVLYATMACGACVAQEAPAIPRAATVPVARPSSGRVDERTAAVDSAATMAARTATRDQNVASPYSFVARTSSRDPAPAGGRTTTRDPAPPGGRSVTRDDGDATAAAVRLSRGQSPSVPPVNLSRTSSSPLAAGTESGPRISRAGTGNPDYETPPLGRASTSNPAIGRTPTPNPGRLPSGNPIAARSPTGNPVASRSPTGNPVAGRAPTPVSSPRAVTGPPFATRPPTGNPIAGRSPTGNPIMARTQTGEPFVSRTMTARKTKALITARWLLVEQGVDHFQLLGVPFDAVPDVCRVAYLGLTRQLHPDKLTELGVDDPDNVAAKLLLQLGAAFAVLTDAARRNDYMTTLLRPDLQLPVIPRTQTSEDRGRDAAEAFKRGESALRRNAPDEACVELARAVELQPQDVDYAGMLGWARFCAATDRAGAAQAARLALERAVQKSTNPMNARFLIGRIERMLGRDREALHHFEQVIDIEPRHQEALAEIRGIEMRARTKK
ncbi:MAG TPA: hypothetical protein VGM90_38410 [Kofleriaceae bacterium]|jgi:hypothetical protein